MDKEHLHNPLLFKGQEVNSPGQEVVTETHYIIEYNGQPSNKICNSRTGRVEFLGEWMGIKRFQVKCINSVSCQQTWNQDGTAEY